MISTKRRKQQNINAQNDDAAGCGDHGRDALRRVRNRIALVAAAICAAAAPLSSFAAGATLTHRWSFTSDYTDSVGETANGTHWGGTNPSFANGQVTFPGTGWGSGSVDLGGPGLTGGGDTTIEIWAKNNALSAAEIMFEYGAPKNKYDGWGGSKQCFAYYWSDENAQGNDIFIVKKGDFTSYSSARYASARRTATGRSR